VTTGADGCCGAFGCSDVALAAFVTTLAFVRVLVCVFLYHYSISITYSPKHYFLSFCWHLAFLYILFGRDRDAGRQLRRTRWRFPASSPAVAQAFTFPFNAGVYRRLFVVGLPTSLTATCCLRGLGSSSRCLVCLLVSISYFFFGALRR